jgi:hypothetical protein
MRKRGLPSASFLLFLSTGLLTPAPSGFAGKAPRHDQPQRPKFSALGVVCEKDVQNAKDSLGAPDGRYAEILPAGQLVVLMENKLYSFPGPGWPGEGGAPADSGSMVGKGGADFSLEGWLPMRDTQGNQHYDWIALGLSVSGFCLPLIDSLLPFDISAGTDMIRIVNLGTKSLFVDAVIGYGRDILATGALLGHSKTMTSLIYSHTDREKKKAAVEKIS